MKTSTVCMCECKCPIRVVEPETIFCASCANGDHWDPRYEMNWAQSFATVVLILMAVALVVWVAQGGIVARP